ncbi:hypothetical protein WJX73_005236 [Symbiochloris irregularis]|uniref:HhH-GPD domain-containing protein n=1 Tax=Symbiochloris irregularis TaxID=706552 RepID=A0AAW1NJL6_9CHLO
MDQTSDLLWSLISWSGFMQKFLSSPLPEPAAALPEVGPLTHAAALIPEQTLPPAPELAPYIASRNDADASAETPPSLPEKRAKKAHTKRARILKPGQLTLAVHGADEAWTWQQRVAAFTGSARQILGDRCLIEGQWGGSVLDSVSRQYHSKDSVNWDAVLAAPVEELAEIIKVRGMHRILALRIQEFLARLRMHGRQRQVPQTLVNTVPTQPEQQRLHVPVLTTNPAAPILQPMQVADGPHPLDLEWLRDVTDDEAQDFLMSINGLGRKSVACIMLLSLRKADFPVDVNVGRISARLGWIPLDAEQALEDLDRYAPEPEVHKYLHSRMMHFPVTTLYELHYLMITLGKVLCTMQDQALEKRQVNLAAALLPGAEQAFARLQHAQDILVRWTGQRGGHTRQADNHQHAEQDMPREESSVCRQALRMPSKSLHLLPDDITWHTGSADTPAQMEAASRAAVTSRPRRTAVNEVFLAQSTLHTPLELPSDATAGWAPCWVHFGSSVGSICRRMRQGQVSQLFASEFICIRSYLPSTGAPHALPAWLLGVSSNRKRSAPTEKPARKPAAGPGAFTDPLAPSTPLREAKALPKLRPQSQEP